MAPGGWAPFLSGDCASARPEEDTTVTESESIKRTLPWRIVAAVIVACGRARGCRSRATAVETGSRRHRHGRHC